MRELLALLNESRHRKKRNQQAGSFGCDLAGEKNCSPVRERR
jgi:hypothetical protein